MNAKKIVADIPKEYSSIERYSDDSRLTNPSSSKRYNFRKMIDMVEKIGRPLTTTEIEGFRIR